MTRRKRSGRIYRLAVGVLAIAAAGSIGLLISTIESPEPIPRMSDAIDLAVEASSNLELSFRTSSAEQAERFVLDRSRRRLTVPDIAGATLGGVAFVSLGTQSEIPILVYKDDINDERLSLFAFSYSVLYEPGVQVAFDRETLQQIEADEAYDIHEISGSSAVVWRHRDEILVAIFRGDAISFGTRVEYPS